MRTSHLCDNLIRNLYIQRAPTTDDSKGAGAATGRQKRKAAAYLDKKPPAGSTASSPEGGTAEPESASDGSSGGARGQECSVTPSSESDPEAASDPPPPVRGRRAKAAPAQPRGQQRATRNAGKTSVGMYDEDVPLSALGALHLSHTCATEPMTTDIAIDIVAI